MRKQRLPYLRVLLHLRRDALVRQAVLRDQRAQLADVGAVLHALGPLERPDRRQHAVRVRRLTDAVPALDHPVVDGLVLRARRHRVRLAQDVAVRPAVAALVLHGLEARDGPRPCRCTSARTPASCRGPSRPAPSRTRRSGTGACRCARPAAARRAPRGAWARHPASRPAPARTAPDRSWARGPRRDTATMRATTRAPSAAMQRRTASAFSRVSLRSDA